MANETLLRLHQVRSRVGLGRSSIYAAIADGRFPKPVSIGARAIAWPESAISAWIAARIEAGQARDTPGHPAAPSSSGKAANHKARSAPRKA